MRIKGMDGHEYSVASAATGNAALTTGIIGTALGVLNNGNGNGLLGGLFGNNCNNRYSNEPIQVLTSEDRAISRYEAGMMDKMAAKDSEIALLKSNTYTDQKLADVYDRLITKINANKEEQTAINMQQAVYNGTNNATVSCLQGQIAQLASLSQLVVPSRNVCDTGCNCG